MKQIGDGTMYFGCGCLIAIILIAICILTIQFLTSYPIIIVMFILMIFTSVIAQLVCDGKVILGYNFRENRGAQIIMFAFLIIIMLTIMCAVFFILSTVVGNELVKQNNLVYLMFR